MMSKPKSNSIINGLPENQRAQLEQWLFEENLSYVDASKRLKADFDISCAPSSLGSFYQATAQRRVRDRIAASCASANQVVNAFKENQADIYSALTQMAGQIAFESAMDGKKFDPKMIAEFSKIVLSAKKQEMEAAHLALDERRIELLEKKAAAYDRAQAALNSVKNAGGVTAETFKKIEAELKLL